LTKGKKRPKRRPIQEEPESCSEGDERNYIVPVETGSDSPSEAKAQEQDVARCRRRGVCGGKIQRKTFNHGFVGMVVDKDEGDWRLDELLQKYPTGHIL